MSVISELITQIRTEVSDDDSIRWSTDSPILTQVKRAINRASLLFIKNGIHFAKSTSAFTTTIGLATYALPTDFKVPDFLFNRTDDYKLIHISDEEYECSQVSPPSAEYWRISGSNIEIVGTPDAAESYIFYYYPTLATSAYTTASTMPWGGRVDDMIIEYSALRLKNIDEMNAAMDAQLGAEFEQNLLNVFGMLTPGRGVEGYSPWE